jgi:hypothetical protein
LLGLYVSRAGQRAPISPAGRRSQPVPGGARRGRHCSLPRDRARKGLTRFRRGRWHHEAVPPEDPQALARVAHRAVFDLAHSLEGDVEIDPRSMVESLVGIWPDCTRRSKRWPKRPRPPGSGRWRGSYGTRRPGRARCSAPLWTPPSPSTGKPASSARRHHRDAEGDGGHYSSGSRTTSKSRPFVTGSSP